MVGRRSAGARRPRLTSKRHPRTASGRVSAASRRPVDVCASTAPLPWRVLARSARLVTGAAAGRRRPTPAGSRSAGPRRLDVGLSAGWVGESPAGSRSPASRSVLGAVLTRPAPPGSLRPTASCACWRAIGSPIGRAQRSPCHHQPALWGDRTPPAAAQRSAWVAHAPISGPQAGSQLARPASTMG